MNPDHRQLYPYLRRFGNRAMAYSTLQEGLEHFVMADAGYIAYTVSNGITISLADPVCAPADAERLLRAFLAQHPSPFFLQISPACAVILQSCGFLINELGIETIIDVQKYSYGGTAKGKMRRYISKARESGVVVAEITAGDSELWQEIALISAEWLASKPANEREMRLLASPAVFGPEPDCRKFVARHNGKVTAYVFFDPIYQENRIIGYFVDLNRRRKDIHPGTLYLIVREAMDRFRAEGVLELNLGLSPLYGITDDSFRHSRLMHHLLRLFYEYGNSFYAYKNVSQTKSRYGGGAENGSYRDRNVRMEKVYVAQRKHFPVREGFEVFRLCGIIGGVWPAVKKLARWR